MRKAIGWAGKGKMNSVSREQLHDPRGDPVASASRRLDIGQLSLHNTLLNLARLIIRVPNSDKPHLSLVRRCARYNRVRRRESPRDDQEFSVDILCIGRKVGFSMAVRTEGRIVLHPITLLNAKDVVNIEKARERSIRTASRALAPCRTSEYSFTHLHVAPHLRTDNFVSL